MLWYVLPWRKPVVSLFLPSDMVVFPAWGGECSSDLKNMKQWMEGRMTQSKILRRGCHCFPLQMGNPRVEVRGWTGAFLGNVMVNIEFIVNLPFQLSNDRNTNCWLVVIIVFKILRRVRSKDIDTWCLMLYNRLTVVERRTYYFEFLVEVWKYLKLQYKTPNSCMFRYAN